MTRAACPISRLAACRQCARLECLSASRRRARATYKKTSPSNSISTIGAVDHWLDSGWPRPGPAFFLDALGTTCTFASSVCLALRLQLHHRRAQPLLSCTDRSNIAAKTSDEVLAASTTLCACQRFDQLQTRRLLQTGCHKTFKVVRSVTAGDEVGRASIGERIRAMRNTEQLRCRHAPACVCT